MRKNAVIREIQPIAGGVCAPLGFSVGGFSCQNGAECAVVSYAKRYATACVFSALSVKSAFVAHAKRATREGTARAILLVHGGVDVGGYEELENVKQASTDCAEKLHLHERDVLPLVCGKTTKSSHPYPTKSDLSILNVSSLQSACSELKIVQNGIAKEFACSFHLGDFICRFGFLGVLSDGFSVIITTDVRISPELLNKALKTEVKDSFSMLVSDCLPSPADAVCFVSSQTAENAVIDVVDSEYDKFVRALHLACAAFCELLLRGKNDAPVVEVVVKGARSKQCAREIAKQVALSPSLIAGVKEQRTDARAIFGAVLKVDAPIDLKKVSAYYSCLEKSVKVLDEGVAIPLSSEVQKSVFDGKTLYITVDLGKGNYRSSAWLSPNFHTQK
jgi:glutamate N-acetyltransferase/amino-acid N-acetyltransferase